MTARYTHKREEFSNICDFSFIISKPLQYMDNSNTSKCFMEKTDIIRYCETPWLHEILPLFSWAMNTTQISAGFIPNQGSHSFALD